MPGNITQLKSQLKSDFINIFSAGDNDSNVVADKLSEAIGNRIESYLNTVKVDKGIKLTADGTGFSGTPVNSSGQTTEEGKLI